eukprot:CAMPEP_0115396968 /NCGR_PEP_ID=MMETSP0271-20121206/13565_1 /TAXON_ID=71861 /ORGANISM="Scrippsiella trochoidea, Strain CCMP3099" /LENGTH=472 /DNA_ID=CAMNT_0002820707 /DNA_START=35 /DNA_END=1453 /DNA_ORIENTATION=+
MAAFRMARPSNTPVVAAVLLVLALPCSADPDLVVPAVGSSAAVVADDECAAGSPEQSHCAVSALQLRGRLLTVDSSSPRRFPQMPSFAAKVMEEPLTLVEVPGKGIADDVNANMTFTYDADRQISELAWDQKGSWFLGPRFAWMPHRVFWTPDGGAYIGNNGTICVPGGVELHTQALRSLWDEMKADKGSFLGETQVRGQPCEVWLVRNASVGNMSICVGADGIPRNLVVEPAVSLVGPTNVAVCSHNLTFFDIRTGAASGASSLQPIVCPSVQYYGCEGNGTSSLQVLRFSHGEPWGHISDRDTFDWNAYALMSHEFGPGYKYLLFYELEVNSSYGPWRECDYNPATHRTACTEMPADVAGLVSRVSAEVLTGKPGVLGSMGQCEANDVVGSWLLFPSQGKCDEGQNVGDQGCTWQLLSWKVFDFQTLEKTFSAKFGNVTRLLSTGKPPFRDIQRMAKAAMTETPVVAASA